MFSPEERRFLNLLRAGAAKDGQLPAPVRDAYPNPVYRRKLLWQIRRKARNGADDWALYTAVARSDPRVLPAASPAGVPSVPLAADLLVLLARRLARRTAPGPRALGRTVTSPSRRRP